MYLHNVKLFVSSTKRDSKLLTDEPINSIGSPQLRDLRFYNIQPIYADGLLHFLTTLKSIIKKKENDGFLSNM